MTMPPAQESAPPRRLLPLGIQSFRKLREDGRYYVDKTPHIERLVEHGGVYFLSRPRRFGKSLLVDTLAELFQGSEELFRGLAIHDRWDWSVRRAIVRLDFARGEFSSVDRLRRTVEDRMADACERAGAPVKHHQASDRLATLIESLHESTGHRVAVLVDEYDKPILDHLKSPDLARANRDFLSGLYGTFKSCDAHIRFVLLTGVSKFSKVNLFSGLNNLEDITLDPVFATICGYTEEELDAVFAPELDGLDRGQVREWYNGYSWLGEPVYNPYDVLLFLRNREFDPHWFETGTPTFLLDVLARQGVASFDLEGIEADNSLLSSFDVDCIEPEALLFQTGYLTVRNVERIGGVRIYRLGYPNREVRQSLHRSLLTFLRGRKLSARQWPDFARALRESDFGGIESQLRSIFAGIPHQWHTRNELAHYEGYYASVFYSFLGGSGLDVRAEDSSAAGRLDAAVLLDDVAYLFELKVAERASAGAALAQLRKRGYAEKYRRPGRAVHLVGVHFSEETRNIVEFEVGEG